MHRWCTVYLRQTKQMKILSPLFYRTRVRPMTSTIAFTEHAIFRYEIQTGTADTLTIPTQPISCSKLS